MRNAPCGQDEQAFSGRFLQGFQKSVLRGLVHRVRLLNDSDLPAGFRDAAQMKQRLEPAEGVDVVGVLADDDFARLGGRGKRVSVGIDTVFQLVAGVAFHTRRAVRFRCRARGQERKDAGERETVIRVGCDHKISVGEPSAEFRTLERIHHHRELSFKVLPVEHEPPP